MYLKKLDICGFKSFADKTEMEFEPGITAIIGPNGCGKSNTLDAIRWCLGEQSARSMRSQQMMDVIFGGSQSRQTTGMAEVSLTFDNSQNVLPIDYAEVKVTRRLFRSGESEYFINKTQCRLKDIRDLFLDTGIGSEGYSIIEQGKVEFLLTAKPEERREMFEEAAGVSKYKVRREETLRKLEKVEIDMNRINDMLALLKEQINSLDLAAKKARQYQKHKDDLKCLEITSAVQNILKNNIEIERIKNELDPKTKEFELSNTELDQLEAGLSQVRVDQVEKDELYVRLQDEFSQIKSQINLSDERIRQTVQRESDLKERRENLTVELESNNQKIDQYEVESKQLQVKCEELKSLVLKYEQDYKDKEIEIQKVRADITECQQFANNLNVNLYHIETKKINLTNEQNKLTSSQAHCQAQVLSLQKELNNLKEQHTPLTEEISLKEKELENINIKINDIKEHHNTLQQKIIQLQNNLKDNQARDIEFKEKIVSQESKRQMLQEWEQKDPLRNTMRKVTSLDIGGIIGPVSGIIRIDSGMEDIVAAAFSEKLNYMITETAQAAQEAIKYLEENNLGRLTFVVLERLPDSLPSSFIAHPVDSRPLISLMQFDSKFEKLINFLCGETIISGNSIYSNAVMQGGGKITFDKPILVEEQIRHLNESIELTQNELVKIREEGKKIQDELLVIQENKKNCEMDLQKAGIDLNWMQKHLKEIKDKIEYLNKQIGSTSSDIQKREEEEKNIKDKLAGIETNLINVETEKQQLTEQQQQTQSDIHNHREEENRLAPLLTESKVAWATQGSELEGREREHQKLKEMISTVKNQIQQSINELAAIETKIVEQTNLQQIETEKLKEFHQAFTQKEIEVQVSLTQRQELINQIDIKNKSLHEIRQKVETYKLDIHNLQLEQRSFDFQKQNLEQRLRDDFNCSFEEMREQYEKLTYSDDEIARLKRRIESMGAVNLAAPEEYANLEERYNFLLTQQQDLVKAKDDMHQVIAKINQNTRENFKITFDKVRENFRNIYNQLFEGGNADLSLTDENNLLETGVDIFAQPPGKKLQNIALLSGGEKALTAIALLFAFFMVRPSPFCILDEVDAPLDDANIGRYINMIKKFSAYSQFLVITHNKRTMEMADILYGVTMEELGVSKIISVRMNKEVAAIA